MDAENDRIIEGEEKKRKRKKKTKKKQVTRGHNIIADRRVEMRKIAFCFHLTDYNSNICFNRLLVNVKRAFIISRVLRDSSTRYVGPSVGRLVGQLVGRSVPFLLFRRFLGSWAHSSFPNASLSHSKSS